MKIPQDCGWGDDDKAEFTQISYKKKEVRP